MKKLLTEEEIRQGVARLAQEVTSHYRDQPLMVVGVLTGSLVLMADMIRRLEMPLRIGLVQASSYRGTATSPGQLTINADLLPDIRSRHVLLIDDIFDTGHTLEQVLAQLRALGPASVRSAVLLRKRERREVGMQPDHVVFDIPNEFVVGYGLDYDDHFRNLPYLAVLEDEDLAQLAKG